MNITKSNLKKIIQEELQKILKEDWKDMARKVAFDAKLAGERKALGRDVGTYQHKEEPKKERSWSDWIYDVTAAPESTVHGDTPSDIQPFARTKMGWGAPGTTAGFQTRDVYDEETEEAGEIAKGATGIAALGGVGLAAGALGGGGGGASMTSNVPRTLGQRYAHDAARRAVPDYAKQMVRPGDAGVFTRLTPAELAKGVAMKPAGYAKHVAQDMARRAASGFPLKPLEEVIQQELQKLLQEEEIF
jgi:hypothetical protein